MIRVLNILLPPLALLLIGKPVRALLNLILCLFFFLPGIIHSWVVTSDWKREKEREDLVRKQKAMYQELNSQHLRERSEPYQPKPNDTNYFDL